MRGHTMRHKGISQLSNSQMAFGNAVAECPSPAGFSTLAATPQKGERH